MNTLKLTVTTLELDNNDNEICSNTSELLFEYNESYKNTILLTSDDTSYTSIPLTTIRSPFLAVLISDDAINYKLNGDEYTASQRTVINTPITTLEVYNPNVTDTNVYIAIYGINNV